MAVETLEGSVVALSISTNLTTPAWKEMVCAEETGISGTREVNKRKTKCGTAVTVSEPEYVVTGSGAAKRTPNAATEASANELFTIFDDGLSVLVKVTDGTGYTRYGQGLMTSYSETANEGEDVAFDFQIDIQGNMSDTIPA